MNKFQKKESRKIKYLLSFPCAVNHETYKSLRRYYRKFKRSEKLNNL